VVDNRYLSPAVLATGHLNKSMHRLAIPMRWRWAAAAELRKLVTSVGDSVSTVADHAIVLDDDAGQLVAVDRLNLDQVSDLHLELSGPRPEMMQAMIHPQL